MAILLLAALDVWERKDPTSLLILFWIAGTVVFASLINWTINGRAILPMVPAVAILLMRRMDSLGTPASPRRRLHPSWALIPAAFLALVVGYADLTSANSGRDAASAIEIKYGQQLQQPNTIWFQGHWGFQYYMDLMGAKPVDPKRARLAVGDLMVIPSNTTHTIPINPKYFILKEQFETQTSRYVATMNYDIGAGFYSNFKSPLPYAFGLVPTETYQIWSLTAGQ